MVFLHGMAVACLKAVMPNKSNLLNDTHLKVMRLLQATPTLQQRDVAKALGISLGKTNYCVNALIDKGLVKMENFRNNQDKMGYAYLLTPKGIAEKAALTGRFLVRKKEEYELLRAEVDLLQREADELGSASPAVRVTSSTSPAQRRNL